MTKCSIGNEDKVIDYILDNKEHLMELLTELKDRKKLSLNSVPVTFHDDILSQYKSMANKIIMQDIAKATNIDAETIMFIIEEMEGYLNG